MQLSISITNDQKENIKKMGKIGSVGGVKGAIKNRLDKIKSYDKE